MPDNDELNQIIIKFVPVTNFSTRSENSATDRELAKAALIAWKDKQVIMLRNDIARAMGHMQGCGHPDKYLEGCYPEFTEHSKELEGR